MLNAYPLAYVIIGIVGIVLVIGWILIPFILMNTNAYLRRILREQERTNDLLEASRRPTRVPTATELPSVRVDPRDK